MEQNKPTQRQVDYAEDIAKELGIELPKAFTKKRYCEFISKYAEEYKNSLDLRN